DSAMFQFPNDTDFQTQGERANAYANRVKSMWNATISNKGSPPFVGHLWWEFHDNAGENSNWGLVSLLDNAYDGREAIRATGRDPRGFPTGGERADYGDFLSTVRATNLEVYAALANEIRQAASVTGKH